MREGGREKETHTDTQTEGVRSTARLERQKMRNILQAEELFSLTEREQHAPATAVLCDM